MDVHTPARTMHHHVQTPKKTKMQKRIKEKILKKQIESEFNVEIVPRHRGKQKEDFIKRTARDNEGNHLNLKGEIIISHVHTDMGKTLTPSEQYQRSRFGRRTQ
jgi:hypothetical protein